MLQKSKLITDLLSLSDIKDRNEFAEKLADAIELYVKSGTVKTVVTTSGGNGTGEGVIE